MQFIEWAQDTLQWGRTFSSAEMARRKAELDMDCHDFNGAALFQVRKFRPDISPIRHDIRLQWGRTFSSAEIDRFFCIGVEYHLLQWGRTFSSAEITLLPGIRHLRPGNFNGAALFQVRK